MRELLIKNEKEMTEFGKKIATGLKGGDILCLHGELGAGKTTLTKGLAQIFGIKQRIKSPTFTLFTVYPGELKHKRTKLVHIDTYRLEDGDEMIDIGIEDYLGNPESVCVVEWPKKISRLLKNKKCIDVYIEHDKNGRLVRF